MKFAPWRERLHKNFGLDGRTFDMGWIFLHWESDDNYFISMKSFG